MGKEAENETKNYMEKPKLTDEQLAQLRRQYYSLTEELAIYRKNMRGRKYRINYPAKEREQHMKQYLFLKLSLKETVKVLMLYKAVDEQLLIDCVFNRFLPLGLRFKAMFTSIPYNQLSKEDNQLSNGQPNKN